LRLATPSDTQHTPTPARQHTQQRTQQQADAPLGAAVQDVVRVHCRRRVGAVHCVFDDLIVQALIRTLLAGLARGAGAGGVGSVAAVPLRLLLLPLLLPLLLCCCTAITADGSAAAACYAEGVHVPV
jgi:hypothetical protein